MSDTDLLVIWHSRTGGAQQMAQAAFEAAATECTARMMRAEEAGADDLYAAKAYLFAAPENLASLSGAMKEFFDRCYYPVLGRIEGRPYAQMICAGTDGHGAARQVARISTGWRLREVQPPLIVLTRAATQDEILAPKTIGPKDLERCSELGAALGAGIAMGVF